ncbi:TasA family protein [Rossellomorea vietnamensis]|uniref:TasA family protein n=1 Tax=Rossellomorea vietnamensis TaxID=218284 RepID=UPI003CED7AB3
MSIKKKLGLGAMSAIMGLSLVGTGTWAAFNDVERVDAKVGAGELNLNLAQLNSEPIDFNISNLKPGDHMTRNIKLQNVGSLAIKEVLLSIEDVTFTNYTPTAGQAGEGDTWESNNAIEYLDQFRVSVVKVGAEGGRGGFPLDIIPSTANVTLADFYLASGSLAGDSAKREDGATQGQINLAKQTVWNNVNRAYLDANSQRLNVATLNPNEWTGLPVVPEDDDVVQIKIEFIDDTTPSPNGDGTYVQNKYQGDTATIKLQFEARQWGGLDVQDSDMKNPDGTGDVETNKEAYSETN